jgi:hypothetical protein
MLSAASVRCRFASHVPVRGGSGGLFIGILEMLS